MLGIIGKKIGMTSFYNAEDAKSIACTVVEAGPCVVTQIKSKDSDGYNAIQMGFGKAKEKNMTAPLKGHLKKADATSSTLVEFKDVNGSFKLGQVLSVTDVFVEGDSCKAIGTSKGKGFQGVVKRYNFGGVGGQTHGQHNRLRHPGSIGACSFPSRVFPGMRMGGRMGSDRVKVQNLKIVKIFSDKNIVLISGSIPGSNNSIVYLEK
ncbi:MAG: 50S ribosomal protein L3 [Cytophagales bacterium]|nr:MAG: 50S ribosomal protein L3 [Cytophagales bacterium]